MNLECSTLGLLIIGHGVYMWVCLCMQNLVQISIQAQMETPRQGYIVRPSQPQEVQDKSAAETIVWKRMLLITG